MDTPSADLVAEASDFGHLSKSDVGILVLHRSMSTKTSVWGETRGITNDDVKAALPMNKILPFMKDANVLAFYYGYSDTHSSA